MSNEHRKHSQLEAKAEWAMEQSSLLLLINGQRKEMRIEGWFGLINDIDTCEGGETKIHVFTREYRMADLTDQRSE